MRSRPTIVDVAARAGVSKSLVSLALRGDDGVSPATRERILAAADELGYRSNALARALRQHRTMLLGVVVGSLDNPYHTEVVESVERAAERHGLSVLLAHGARRAGRMAARLDALGDLDVDGLVVVSSWADPELLQAAARRAPVAMVGRSLEPVAGIDSVNNDDERGAALAVGHLVAAGHERIAHLTSSRRPAGLARRAGYEHAMASHGLDRHVRVIERGRDEPAGPGLDAALADGCSAVFARNDVEAFDALDHAWDRGIDVPAGLAVVGYDDSALALRARPRLTSVHQPRAEMGALAVELLRERWAGRTADRHEVLTPRLVVRASA
ncbi:LacI family DNA-binding transcriptional regulator [Myceligenerans salitolerans]|uniref:LacI family DNA-binding transcriptional regulator n=1 Tax=Myceligenerans salitolerans TaxID=1230528 RepID=A0ABS3I5P4_9MICO|nr:LacI family DNA-binding transcriptional regulator [Myceligenerans salitolerans]MBO0608321.1 LacI family DNA-binding transcriptional regulator [Myceligenerans salitolerans]